MQEKKYRLLQDYNTPYIKYKKGIIGNLKIYNELDYRLWFGKEPFLDTTKIRFEEFVNGEDKWFEEVIEEPKCLDKNENEIKNGDYIFLINFNIIEKIAIILYHTPHKLGIPIRTTNYEILNNKCIKVTSENCLELLGLEPDKRITAFEKLLNIYNNVNDLPLHKQFIDILESFLQNPNSSSNIEKQAKWIPKWNEPDYYYFYNVKNQKINGIRYNDDEQDEINIMLDNYFQTYEECENWLNEYCKDYVRIMFDGNKQPKIMKIEKAPKNHTLQSITNKEKLNYLSNQ